MRKRNLYLIRFLQKIQIKIVFLKQQEKMQQIQYQKDIMEQYLHMVKQEQEKHIQWQETLKMKKKKE